MEKETPKGHDNVDKYFDWAYRVWKNTFVESLPIPLENLKKSANARQIDTMRKIVYSMSIPPVHSMASTFQLKNRLTGSGAIYAIIYGEEQKPYAIYPSGSLIHSGMILKYHCVSPSYSSADGEYRTDFAVFISITVFRTYMSSLFNNVAKYVMERFSSRRNYEVSVQHYAFEKQQHTTKSLDIAINYYDLPLALLSVAWFKMAYQSYNDLLDTHVNPMYLTLFKMTKKDTKFFKYILNTHGIAQIKLAWNLLSHTVSIPINSLLSVGLESAIHPHLKRFGQKIIPISVLEAREFGNIKYPIWREYAISNRVSELVVNNVSSGFPLCYTWFFVKSDSNMYDNITQKFRIEKGTDITGIIKNLGDIQTSLTQIGDVPKQKGAKLSSWIFHRINSFKDILSQPIEFGKELVLSDTSVVFVSEYVGKTFLYYLFHKDPKVGDLLADSNLLILKKCVFEVAYNLYIIYKRLGVLHSDLHLNNLTVKEKLMVWTKKEDEFTEVYDFGKMKFVFPARAFNIALIDFSRSCVLSKHLPEMFDLNRPVKQFFLNKLNLPEFLYDQTDRIVSNYLYIFPHMEKHKYLLFNFVQKHEEEMFKLLSILDLYYFVSSILQTVDEHSLPIGSQASEFLKQCKIVTEKYVVTDIDALVNSTMNISSVSNMEEPMLHFVKVMFPDYMVNTPNYSKVVDYYDIGQQLQFSLNTPDLLPIYISHAKYIDPMGTEKDIDPVGTEHHARLFQQAEKNIIAHLKRIKNYFRQY